MRLLMSAAGCDKFFFALRTESGGSGAMLSLPVRLGQLDQYETASLVRSIARALERDDMADALRSFPGVTDREDC